MRPSTFGFIIFLEIMLLDGIFATSTLKQRHHILPFEDYNQEDVMQITISKDENGIVFGEKQGDQNAILILTGKNTLTETELEETRVIYSDVTFKEVKK